MIVETLRKHPIILIPINIFFVLFIMNFTGFEIGSTERLLFMFSAYVFLYMIERLLLDATKPVKVKTIEEIIDEAWAENKKERGHKKERVS